MFFLVCEADKEEGERTSDDHHDEVPVPSEAVDDESHADVGQQRRAEEIAKETGQSGSRPGSVLRGQVEGVHADEHHGAVDEESDGYQADDVKGGVSGRGEPVDGHEDGHERHVDHRRDGAASLEELVAEPPAEDGAGDGGELIGEVSPAHVLQVVSLDVLQVGRSPV